MRRLSFSGGARALVHYDMGLFRFPVGINIALGSLDLRVISLFDTGAAWSVLGDEWGEALQDDLIPCGSAERLSTRFGTFEGAPHRLKMWLLADRDMGHHLELDATFLLLREWPGPVILGLSGCLEHISFAYEPDLIAQESCLWWGSPSRER